MDEAADTGAVGRPPLANDQPVVAVAAGLFVEIARLPYLTRHLLDLKQRCFPRLPYLTATPLVCCARLAIDLL